MASRDTGKLAMAVIVPPGPTLFDDSPGTVVVDALQSDTLVIRYGRTWRVGGVLVENGFLYGRLGFESTHPEDLWDPDKKDFDEVDVPGGVAAPFAIRLADLRVVFQVRGPFIRITSFTGALRALLREATFNDGWQIEFRQNRMAFRTWRETVKRVTRLRARLEPPNPNYEGRPSIRALIEGAHLVGANLDLQSEDLNTDAEIVRELLDHVQRGYGEATVIGQRDTDAGEVETVYSTALGGSTDVTEAPVNEDTGEVGRETLVAELNRPEE
jgi:hypothetical protein